MSLISRGPWRLAELEFGAHQAMYKVAVLTGSDSLLRGMLIGSERTRMLDPRSLRTTKEALGMIIDACTKASEALDALLANETNQPGDDRPAIVTRRTP